MGAEGAATDRPMRRAGPRGRAAAAAARRAAATASPGCATAAVTDRGSKLSPTASPGSATAAVTDRGSKLSPSAATAALLLLLLAALAAPRPAAAQGPRPRPEWEKDIVHKYTLGGRGGWADVDPTPGGCDDPKGNECGPWRQEPIPYSAGKQKYAMKHVKKHKVMKKWKVRISGRRQSVALVD